MKHLLIPYTQSLADAIEAVDTDDLRGAQADIAEVVTTADQDRRADGKRIANLLDIDPPRYYSNYERTVEGLRESMQERIAEHVGYYGDLHGLDVGDLAHEETDRAVPTYTYKRLIMIAERPEILDAGDVEGGEVALGGEAAWSFDQLFGECIYHHLREIAERAGREYMDACCEDCGTLEESRGCPVCDSEEEAD